MTELNWQYNAYGVLALPLEPKILMLPSESSWSLPHVVIKDDSPLYELNQPMGKSLGAKVTTLRRIHATCDEESHQATIICELENHSTVWKPPTHSRWIDASTLSDLALTHPEHKSIIEAYLAEAESGVIPECRPPWARRMWLDVASTWIEEQIDRLGYTLTEPIEQFQSWSISCVLRAKTDVGFVYFKQAAKLPIFSNEPSVTERLAELYPEHIPTPLAIDYERGWMLLKDFGEEIGNKGSSEIQNEMFRIFSHMQIDAAKRVKDLLAAGCLDRRLDKLAMHLDSLLSDAKTLSRLDELQIKKLHDLAPALKDMCSALSTYNVPQTLVHGDLHWWNIAYQNSHLIFFDWTDSCISHPFLDMINIFGEEDITKKQEWRDVYLGSWTDYEPMERLLEIWEIAEPLSALHQVISYQNIVNNVEEASKWELLDGFDEFAEQLLNCEK